MLEAVVVVATIITRPYNKSYKVCTKRHTYNIKFSQFPEALSGERRCKMIPLRCYTEGSHWSYLTSTAFLSTDFKIKDDITRTC